MSSGKHRPTWLAPSLRGYRREWLGADLVGGLAAGAVVVPQAMAYATIANLPVQVGLYTCIAPMAVYALLGGSRAMSVSTTSTIATLTATTLVSAGVASQADDAAGSLGALVALTILVGVFLLIARLLRWGALVENISSATVLGLKIGVGATVAVGQLPKLLGEAEGVSGEGFVRAVGAVVAALPSVNAATIVLSAGTLLVLVALQRFARRVPAGLVVIVGGILAVALADIDELGVALIAPVPSGLPLPALPDLTALGALVPGALAIAVMAFLESATVARAVRRRDEPQVDSDQELFALGAANAVGAFFTAMPAAGGFSQSAVNGNGGARTQLSELVTVMLAVLVAMFLGPVLSLLPQATLAVVVLVAVAGLIDIPLLVRWWTLSRIDFWVALVVAVIGMGAGLLAAVGAGVIATLYLVLRELNQPIIDIVGRRGAAIAIRVGRGVYAANARATEAAILAVAGREPGLTALVLDLVRADPLTVTVLDMLEDLDGELHARGIELHVAQLTDRAVAMASRTAWFTELERQGRVHASPQAGLGGAPDPA